MNNEFVWHKELVRRVFRSVFRPIPRLDLCKFDFYTYIHRYFYNRIALRIINNHSVMVFRFGIVCYCLGTRCHFSDLTPIYKRKHQQLFMTYKI